MNKMRSVKPGDDWRLNDLTAYDIVLRSQDAAQFFVRPLQPIDHLDHRLFSPISDPIPRGLAKVDLSIYQFISRLKFLEAGMAPGEGLYSQFVISTLEITGYDEDSMMLSAYPISFSVCGQVAQMARPAGPTLVHYSDILLLVGRVSKLGGDVNLKAQVVADAVAAFQHNNNTRTKLGHPPLEFMNIPCTTLVGMRPTFYKVPVTKALSDAVTLGQCPDIQTIVTFCAPPAPSADEAVGMDDVPYRRLCLQYYEAFRDTAKECWTPFLDGISSQEQLGFSLIIS